MISQDTLGRRNRYIPSSTGKRVALKPRDLRWLEAIRDHGPLPSDVLHAFTAEEYGSPKSSRIRLADLSHEQNTIHGGSYLTKPAAQRARTNALNMPLVYDLTDAGWAALGLRREACTRPTGPFAHQLMVSMVTATIELGCERNKGLRFIPGWQILRRANASIGVELRIAVPPRKEPRLHRLVPDQLFALEYAQNGNKQYLSFAVECDRGTEPLTSSNAGRKSALRNYLEYRCLIGEGLFKPRYGLSCNMVVLNVFDSTRRMEAHLNMLGAAFPGGSTFMLFKSFEAVSGHGPEAMALDLFIEPWLRTGSEPISISAPVS